MEKINQVQKRYDLEQRTLMFSQDVRHFLKKVPNTISNREDGKQLIRSSGSVGANYCEASESLGDRDFPMKIRICLREAKESKFWLQVLDVGERIELQADREKLIDEARQLLLIFAAILRTHEINRRHRNDH